MGDLPTAFTLGSSSPRGRQHEEMLKRVERMRQQELRARFATCPKAGLLDLPLRHTFSGRTGLEIKIPYATNTRRDYINNKIQVTVLDRKFFGKWLKMDQEMNELYGEMRKLNVPDGIIGHALLRTGMMVAVFEKYSDPIGRFRRAQILSVLPTRSLEQPIVICKIVDEGRTTSCPRTNIYMLGRKFARIPAKTIDVQLTNVRNFVGSPKFGRLFETVVARHAHRGFSMIYRDQDEPYYVELFSRHIAESINHYLILQMTLPDRRDLAFRRPVKGIKLEHVSVLHVKQSGRLFIRLLSRAEKAIEALLREANKEFLLYRDLLSDTDVFSRDVSQVCVGIHPSTRSAGRCRIFSKTLNPENKKIVAQVLWIDYGNESVVAISELIPARFLSKVLNEAQGLVQEFQLANIEKLGSKSKFLSVISGNVHLTMRILASTIDTGSTHRPVIELLFQKSTPGRPEWQVINDLMINSGLVKSCPSRLGFKKLLIFEPNDLCRTDMQYHSAEWILRKHSPSYSTFISPGDCITFYISKYCESRISSGTFILHPQASKIAFENMRESLATLEQLFPWVHKYFLANRAPVLPPGEFCLYWNGSEYHRARVTRRVLRESYAYEGDDLAELLLIDSGEIRGFPYVSIFRMLPSLFFTKLGPQAAIGRWNGNRRRPICPLNQEMQAKVVELRIEECGRAFMVLEPFLEEGECRRNCTDKKT